MKLALAAAALLALAPLAKADSTTYVYQGNTLDQPGNLVGQTLCDCAISGELTFAAPLALPTDIETVTGTPTSYSFSVDGYTLTQANSVINGFGLGDLTWDLYLLGQNGLAINIQCVDGCGDGGGATDYVELNGVTIGVAVGDKGTWTTEVPEPATDILLLAAIAGLWMLRRHRSRR
jgi:hypothetical protein